MSAGNHLAFLKSSRDLESSIDVSELMRILQSPEPMLASLKVNSSLRDSAAQPSDWAVYFNPDSDSLLVFSNQLNSPETAETTRKLVHDANNLLARLVLQVELLKSEALPPEASELVDQVGNTIEDLTVLLKRKRT